jgi:histidyl-tRNA synthetase
MLTKGPRGTKDILPSNIGEWRHVERAIRKACRLFGFKEIRTPIFEHTELFLRGIGETTDVVEKEMYTFTDRGDRSITLRPENTASAVRAFLEHKLYADAQVNKLFYIGPMFRYDRPQAGRYRQFHQFGVESLGSSSAAADAEVILLAVQFLKSLGLNELKLNINSVGCPKCRPVYRKKLQDFLADKKDGLCEDCKSRFAKNPLRILDCKNEHCQEVSSGAPEMADCLCEECHDHFEQLKTLLGAAGVEYTLNPRLVRGLDYYTKTAFEIQYAPLGAQSAVCGGGRYDGLVAECGGPVTPAVGFAAGLERVLLALEKQNLLPKETAEIDAAVISLGDKAQGAAFSILCDLRKNSLTAEMDFGGRSLKAQMKQANKSGAKYAVIIGEDEINAGEAVIKNMENGEQEKAAIKDIVNKLTNLLTEVIN